MKLIKNKLKRQGRKLYETLKDFNVLVIKDFNDIINKIDKIDKNYHYYKNKIIKLIKKMSNLETAIKNFYQPLQPEKITKWQELTYKNEL